MPWSTKIRCSQQAVYISPELLLMQLSIANLKNGITYNGEQLVPLGSSVCIAQDVGRKQKVTPAQHFDHEDTKETVEVDIVISICCHLQRGRGFELVRERRELPSLDGGSSPALARKNGTLRSHASGLHHPLLDFLSNYIARSQCVSCSCGHDGHAFLLQIKYGTLTISAEEFCAGKQGKEKGLKQYCPR